MKRLCVLVLLLLLSAGLSSSFRCGRRIIRVGDSMYDVRSKCGAPTAIEIEKVGIGVTRRRIIRVRKVETWIYDLGRTRFISDLTL